jgi:hypothetical protein
LYFLPKMISIKHDSIKTIQTKRYKFCAILF